MTCRDIIVSKLKELGADGLYNEQADCYCYLYDIKICVMVCPKNRTDCVAAKLIDGKWEVVPEKVEDKPQKVIMVETPTRNINTK